MLSFTAFLQSPHGLPSVSSPTSNVPIYIPFSFKVHQMLLITFYLPIIFVFIVNVQKPPETLRSGYLSDNFRVSF